MAEVHKPSAGGMWRRRRREAQVASKLACLTAPGQGETLSQGERKEKKEEDGAYGTTLEVILWPPHVCAHTYTHV